MSFVESLLPLSMPVAVVPELLSIVIDCRSSCNNKFMKKQNFVKTAPPFEKVRLLNLVHKIRMTYGSLVRKLELACFSTREP